MRVVGFIVGAAWTVVGFIGLYMILTIPIAPQPEPEVNMDYWKVDPSGLPVAPAITLEAKP